MTTVCAFVLTRNRKELLVDCLRALLAQTRGVDQIVVVDNASTDGTFEHLREEGLIEVDRLSFNRLETNTGSAGGYAEGVRLALETDADWLWTMDDDSEPRPDALERMLTAPAADDPSTAALCTTVLDLAGAIDPLHRCSMGRFARPLPTEAYRPGSAPRVDLASFVGLMIRMSVARAIGLPKAELFITFDDAEYSLRARRHGDLRLIPESVTVHKLHMGGGSPTRRSRFWNRVLGETYTSASWEGFWKNLYGIRNFVWIRHAYGHVGRAEFAALVTTYMVKSLLYDRRPLRRLPWIARYALRGRRGDFSGPSPEEWQRLVGR